MLRVPCNIFIWSATVEEDDRKEGSADMSSQVKQSANLERIKSAQSTENAVLPPFLKWAGGKRWIVPSVRQFIPKRIDKYIEPFLGSGAMYFHINPSSALLADVNEELIETYLAIQLDWKKVSKLLGAHHTKHSKKHYYEVRDQNLRDLFSKAARFIYLNRTCWNGLYRVNQAGAFNVPKGTKTNVLLDSDDFESVANRLFDADLRVCDFEEAIDESVAGDFIFADPPYTVKHNLNGFIKYNETLFSWDDQIRLRNALARARERGVSILLTNANHESVRELYADGFNQFGLDRASVIAGDPTFRGTTCELVVTSKPIRREAASLNLKFARFSCKTRPSQT